MSRLCGLRSWTTLIVVVLSVVFAPVRTDAADDRRLALVVTNQNYPEIGSLAYTHADGEIVSRALKAVGFEVERVHDLQREDFRAVLRKFANTVRAAGPDTIALFYFSGHTGEDGRRNYLYFSDATELASLKDEDEVKRNVAEKAGVAYNEVVTLLASLPAKARLVVVDSHLDMDEPALLVDGQLFATQGRPGLNAADSNNYSQSLSGALLTPGLDLDAVFRQVEVRVAEMTNGRQIPYFVNKLGTRLVLNSGQTTVAHEAAADPEDKLIEEPLWSSVKGSANNRLLQVYLQRFPEGRYAKEARAQIEENERLATLSARPVGASAPGRRVALVIGNSAYQGMSSLKNPANDARAVARSLNQIGFQVVQERYDLGREGMLQAIRTFGEATKGADWVMIYYAGHGLEVKGINYLVPTDAKLLDEEDVEEEAVPMTRLLDRLRDSSGVKILVLDACRDNPLVSRMIRRNATRSGANRGLVEIQAVSGTLIAYATNPGDVAYDGDGAHSPYVTALIKHMVEVADVRLMFSAVYETVDQLTNGRQKPWYAAQLPGRPLVLRAK